MSKGKASIKDIQRIEYQPPDQYGLDLEVMPVPLSALKKHAAKDTLRTTHRLDFHMLMCVRKGRFTHTVDFKPVACGPGSLLVLRPAQVQSFDMASRWEGWVVIFRPEFLQPLQARSHVDDLNDLKAFGSLEALPTHLSLGKPESHAVNECMRQMYNDAQMKAPTAEVHSLLRHLLYSLLLRLHLVHGQQEAMRDTSPLNLQRFKRFQRLVEERFLTQHQVGVYAQQLGCSEKSLARATLEVAGLSAKAYIVTRISLEAKRLLAQTTLPVAVIGDRIGFDEATNFVKFFKREVGCAPSEFRRLQVK